MGKSDIYRKGVRQITVEVSRYGKNWVPEAYICRAYPRDTKLKVGVGVMASPEKAQERAIAHVEQIIRDQDRITVPRREKPMPADPFAPPKKKKPSLGI